MNHWLYSANTTRYRVLDAFDGDQVVWPMSTNVLVGDTVFIYLSSPYKKIGYITTVSSIDVDTKTVHHYTKQFIKTPSQSAIPKKSFMLLGSINCLMNQENSALSYESLKQHGLNGALLGPRKLENNPALLDYIKNHT